MPNPLPLPSSRPRPGRPLTPRSRRRCLGLFALTCALTVLGQLVLALSGAAGHEGRGAQPPSVAVAYQAGRFDRTARAAPDLPQGAEELLGLGVLAAIVYGLRAVELGRAPRSD